MSVAAPHPGYQDDRCLCHAQGPPGARAGAAVCCVCGESRIMSVSTMTRVVESWMLLLCLCVCVIKVELQALLRLEDRIQAPLPCCSAPVGWPRARLHPEGQCHTCTLLPDAASLCGAAGSATKSGDPESQAYFQCSLWLCLLYVPRPPTFNIRMCEIL